MFSVIIPLHNKAPFVLRAINSVLNQSIQDFEIIVVDDGSTDGGGELISAHYGAKVRVISQGNQGVSAARNTGIRNAAFEYLAFLDADDMWHPDFLFWMNDILSKSPDIKILGSSYTNTIIPNVIENPRISFLEDYYNQAVRNTLFTSSSSVIHRSFFKANVGFKSHLIRGEDIDVWLRAFDWFGKAAYIHAPLMFYDLEASASLSTSPELRQTILSEMYTDDYAISDRFPSWNSFRDKYLLLNLLFFFDQEENFEVGNVLLQKKKNSYFLCEIPYHLPYNAVKPLISNPLFKSLIRKYFKFCFRYIYT